MQKSKAQVKIQNRPAKRLGEIIVLNYGKGIAKNERNASGKYPIYGANGVLDYTDKYLVEGEAVIVGRKGSAGEITKVSGKFWPSDVTYYILGNAKVNIDYLFHALKNLNLQRLAVGVKPGINRNRIYELEIHLPPLLEQKKIVAKLERVLGKISEAKKLRAEARESADNLLSAELHKIFSASQYKHTNKLEYVGMSSMSKNGWQEKELDQICDFQNGLWKAKREPSKLVEVLRNTNFKNNDGTLNYDDVAEIEVDFWQLEKRFLQKDDIILERSGGGPEQPVGRVVYFDGENNRYSFSNFTTRIRPSEKDLYGKYLYLFLLFFYKSGKTEAMQKQTTGIRNLTFFEYKKIKIPLPPLAEQKKIVKHLDLISGKVRELQQYQKSTQLDFSTLEQAILQKAFV